MFRLFCALLLLAVSTVNAFRSSFVGNSVPAAVSGGSKLTMEYIPSGMSKDQWKKLKDQEKVKKNLGKVGITKFQSRSFADWQKAGGKNLFPVDPKEIKNPKDLPYMMRPGGSADDVDLKKGGNPFAKLFGGKKKAEPVEEAPKSQNWWTLK